MKNNFKELIQDLTDRELLFHLYLTQFILFILSLAIGFFLYKDIGFFLPYFRWDEKSFIIIGAGSGLLIVALDLFLMKVLPKSYYDDGGLNEKIFKNRNILHIALIAFIVAFCEELLFRGIIQHHLGIIVASFIFAIIHYRYLFNWYLFLNIIILSFFIGFLYEKTENLAVTFLLHFIVDFLLGCFIMLKNRNDTKEVKLNE